MIGTGAVILLWLMIRVRMGGGGRRGHRRMIRREMRRAHRRNNGRQRDGDGSGATFWRPATDVISRPSLDPLYGRPGYLRALARLVVGALAATLIWAAVTDLSALLLALRITGGVCAGGGVAVLVWRWRGRERRARRHALFVAIGRLLELPQPEYARSGKKWITYNNDELSENASIEITVPADFLGTSTQMDGITRIINQRLPGEWEQIARLDRLSLHYEHPPAPPTIARYADYERYFTGGSEHILPIGPSDRSQMVTVDLKQDSPHLAIVAGSGGGKSTQLALQIARALHHGAERVDILDIRRTSQIELADVPGVYIHRTVEECVAAIAEYRAEVLRRQQITEDLKQREYSGARWVLAIEEMSTLSEEIRRHWRNTKDKKDPATPPAIDNLAFLSSIGRASLITMMVVMQYGAARMFGGPAAKSNFAAFILLRFRPQAWRLLVGTTPIPASPSAPGRGWAVVGETERLVQLVLASPDEVVRLASTGANAGRAAADAVPIGDVERTTDPAAEVSMDMSIDTGEGDVSLGVPRAQGGWTPDVSAWTSAPTPLPPRPPVAELDAVLAALGLPDLPDPASPPGSDVDRDETVPAGPPPAVPAAPDRHLTLISHPDRIVGWDAAADLLGMARAALVKAADRDKKHFPEGWREGSRRVWFAADLLAWQSGRPVAGQRDREDPPQASSDI